MKRTLALTGAALILAGLAAVPAYADPPPCPPTDDACAALAARLDTLHTDITDLNESMVASSGEPVSGTVALDADASDRLDLIWWGAWALVGFALLSIVAVAWRRVFAWGISGANT